MTAQVCITSCAINFTSASAQEPPLIQHPCSASTWSPPPSCIRVSDEVQQALRNHQPVVALESTIISHGMPYPDNLATAMSVEQVVRDAGAVPATIAILDGVPCVGLSSSQLTRWVSVPSWTFTTKPPQDCQGAQRTQDVTPGPRRRHGQETTRRNHGVGNHGACPSCRHRCVCHWRYAVAPPWQQWMSCCHLHRHWGCASWG